MDKNELISIADRLYKHVNPESKKDTPSSVYVTVIEKWHPEYCNEKSNLNFFDWCLKNKN